MQCGEGRARGRGQGRIEGGQVGHLRGIQMESSLRSRGILRASDIFHTLPNIMEYVIGFLLEEHFLFFLYTVRSVGLKESRL